MKAEFRHDWYDPKPKADKRKRSLVQRCVMPDFTKMPKGFKRTIWFIIYRIRHTPLWCSWCRNWGPWTPIEGKPHSHEEKA